MRAAREKFGAIVSHGLLRHSDHAEMPADNIGSMAFAAAAARSDGKQIEGKLYSALWRLKYGSTEHAPSKSDAELMMRYMQYTYGRRFHSVKARRVVIAAMTEWLNDRCRKCQGRGQIFTGELQKVCPVCDDKKRMPWSDTKRAAHFGKETLSAGAMRDWERTLAQLAIIDKSAGYRYSNALRK